MNYDASLIANVVMITLAVQVIIATGELLILHRVYRKDGLLSWVVQRTGPKLGTYVKMLRLDFVCRYPNVLVFFALRILCAMALPVAILFDYPTLPLLLIITATGLIMQVRNSQSNDGSDQMAIIGFIALTLASVIDTDVSWSYALFFIAAQASLAYGVSGFLKSQKKGWYNGEYVTEILKTSSYGDKKMLKAALKRKWIAKALGQKVVYGDCLLAISFAFPPVVCISVLSFGIILHIGIARIMGLNTFLWSYVSTYPAILYVSSVIYS